MAKTDEMGDSRPINQRLLPMCRKRKPRALRVRVRVEVTGDVFTSNFMLGEIFLRNLSHLKVGDLRVLHTLPLRERTSKR